ncbi:MAG: dipeptidase PepE [Vicinamibacteria bacterium]
MNLLLLSNSTNHGAGYLDHAMTEVKALFGDHRRIAFVPFALADHQAYTAKVAARFEKEGIEVDRVTPDADGRAVVDRCQAIFVGGGNTFRLLDALQRSTLLHVLRERAVAGMPYLGASAGTNIAAPTIRTTNDMPIVQPASFEALSLVPFQINPHYLDADPSSSHMGETRETRLREYLEENTVPVVGLREGAWIRIDGDVRTLGGVTGARFFRRGAEPSELAPGSDLASVL